MRENIWMKSNADEIAATLRSTEATYCWPTKYWHEDYAVSWFNLIEITCEKEQLIWTILLSNRTHVSVLPCTSYRVNRHHRQLCKYDSTACSNQTITWHHDFAADDHRISTFFSALHFPSQNSSEKKNPFELNIFMVFYYFLACCFNILLTSRRFPVEISSFFHESFLFT